VLKDIYKPMQAYISCNL